MTSAESWTATQWFERRRYERILFFCPVTLVIAPGGSTALGRSLDVSLAGVRVMTFASARKGQLVRVRFHLKVHGRDVVEEVDGRVANVTVDDHVNSLGIEFLNPLRGSDSPALFARIGHF